MKKKNRNFLIICASIFVVGVITCVVGLSLGGLQKTMGTMDKRNLPVDVMTGINTVEKYEFDNINDLDIKGHSNGVTFVPSNGDQYRIEVKHDKGYEVSVKEDEEKVTIDNTSKRGQVSFFDNEGTEIQIYYPKDKVLETVQVLGSLGDIENLVAKNVYIESGNDVDGIKADKAVLGVAVDADNIDVLALEVKVAQGYDVELGFLVNEREYDYNAPDNSLVTIDDRAVPTVKKSGASKKITFTVEENLKNDNCYSKYWDDECEDCDIDDKFDYNDEYKNSKGMINIEMEFDNNLVNSYNLSRMMA